MAGQLPVVSAGSAWVPPEGYVLEDSYVGSLSACRTQGEQGVASGKWKAYVCHQEMRKLTDIWMSFMYLYVKK
ncbi:hypothetical protein [Streptomyces sp. G44]|uniref:hypothetical protein n=1 Tax=Streptomyces sp. G44 TaxID=2807632 RepID=UPI00195F538D|nr:hypothetical protein [Streptomyces sp. G44]